MHRAEISSAQFCNQVHCGARCGGDNLGAARGRAEKGVIKAGLESRCAEHRGSAGLIYIRFVHLTKPIPKSIDDGTEVN